METETKSPVNEPDFKQLVEGVTDLIWLAEVDGTITYLSPQFKTLFGLEPQDWIGKLPLGLVHPDDVEPLRESIRRQNGKHERVSIEFRHLCHDGSYLWIGVNALPIFDENGRMVCRQGTARDISQIKATEVAIREAQTQLQTMTENLPGVIARLALHSDGSQSFQYVSPNVRELGGLDPETLMNDGSEFWKRVHSDDLEELQRAMFRSAETLEPLHCAYRVDLEERGIRWVETWCLPSRLPNADIVFDGIVIDVTDLGRLDSLEREINFRQIFDNAPDAVFLIATDGDEKGRIVAANKAAEHMHGCQAGELKGKLIVELDAPDAAKQVPERLERLAKGEALTFEIDHLHSDGTVFPVEVTASRISIDGRSYVLGFDRDLTQRKKVEKERSDLQNQLLKTQKQAAELDLTKTQSQLQKIAENIPGLVYQFVLRPDGTQTVTYISPKCREFFGVDPEEILKDSNAFWRSLEPEDLEQAQEKVADSARTLEPYSIEYRVTVTGQGIRWYSDIGQPQQQPNGDIVWDGVMLDVTDRREVELANAVLEKVTRTKDLFLANMSHELRTPLSAILGMTEGLRQGVYGKITPEQAKSLTVVEESGLHLLNLINEVLDLSKIETGKVSLEFSEVDVDQICRSCVDIVSSEAVKKQITLSFNADSNLPALQADPTRLRQILLNLLGNAVKFTSEGGEVNLTAEHLPSNENSDRKNKLRFTVTDNGIGIAPDQIDMLFEPFVQVDDSLSRKYAGSGLGLALVKRHVELHSGSIRVESDPGKGSRFTVDLPCSNMKSMIESSPIESPALESSNVFDTEDSDHADSEIKPLVLLAEDNEHVAMAIVPILEMSGFRVVRVIDGKQAVESTLELSPDLILMDIQMPVLDGLEAIRQIRTHSRFDNLPIIALSGFAMAEDSQRCIEAGVDAFISKPCKMPELISAVRKLISSRKT